MSDLHPHLHVLESRGVHAYVEAILGARAYLVGGGVRDELMGGVCDDFDFTTPLLPEEIEQAIRNEGRKPLLMGKRYGTVKFVTPDGKLQIDVTSHRTERYEDGSRQPIAVFGCSLHEDLLRRDFTINAIARRSNGRLIDPFGGQADLAARVLRTPGPPKRTFNEDPLRMLRAARFVTRLGFVVDERTEKAMLDRAHRIIYKHPESGKRQVSDERILPELDKLLEEPDPTAGLDLLARTHVLNFVLPELAVQVGYDQNSKYHSLELWEHTKAVVAGVPADLTLRWAALLHDVAKPATRVLNKKSGYFNYPKHDMLGAVMVEDIGRRLRMPKDRIMVVRDIVENHLLDSSPLKEADDAAKGEDAA